MSGDGGSVLVSFLRSVRDRLQRVRWAMNTRSASVTLFSPREIVLIGWTGAATFITLNVVLRFIVRRFISREVSRPPVFPRFWPISVFDIQLFNLASERLLLLVSAATLVFVLMTGYVLSDRNGVGPVLGGGSVLLVLTNLLQGEYRGLVVPFLYRGSYYQAAIRITNPVAFVRTYDERQLELPLHATTHPPGSVLTPYTFEQLLGSPTRVSLASTKHVAVAMAVVSLVVSGYLLYRLLLTYFEPDLAQYVTFLFVLLPAVQIYYLVSLDPVILTVFVGAVYCFTRESRVVAGVGTFCCLVLAAWHTFMVVFLVPVLGGIALYRRDQMGLLMTQFLGLVGCYLVADLLLEYNYVTSFLIASKQQTVAATQHFRPTEQQVRTATLQSTRGFLLLTDPAKYVLTRIEDVAEIALFFTPYLCVLCARGVAALRTRREAFVLFVFGVLSLAGLFAAGVYHTGETARAAMYIYPFLLLPVAAVLHSADPTRRDKWVLAALVFAQSVVMQFIGFYHW
jgi:uncharacterized membrane protein YeaQ/YmgE (transglycosylase-associated protein family)/lipid-A-disaccharide synthase-like uncharacterized protein